MSIIYAVLGGAFTLGVFVLGFRQGFRMGNTAVRNRGERPEFVRAADQSVVTAPDWRKAKKKAELEGKELPPILNDFMKG